MGRKILKIISVFILGVILLISMIYLTAPSGAEFIHKNPTTTALMRKRSAEYRKAGKQIPVRWRWVPLSQISPHLIHAVILAEDARFYQHSGYDLEAMKFALEKNLKRKKFAVGGSTITQQLARNLYLSPKKSLYRKFRELLIAYKMEKVLSKRRILELYLNIIELGRGIYGVEAAAQYYFGKSAAELNVQEASQLVTILPSPRRHAPKDGSRFTEQRYRQLLKWMLVTGKIDSTIYYQLTDQNPGQIQQFLDTSKFTPHMDTLQIDQLPELSDTNA